jgi:hypothetical protein
VVIAVAAAVVSSWCDKLQLHVVCAVSAATATDSLQQQQQPQQQLVETCAATAVPVISAIKSFSAVPVMCRDRHHYVNKAMVRCYRISIRLDEQFQHSTARYEASLQQICRT